MLLICVILKYEVINIFKRLYKQHSLQGDFSHQVRTMNFEEKSLKFLNKDSML